MNQHQFFLFSNRIKTISNYFTFAICTILAFTSNAQSTSINGIISDSYHQPLLGASISSMDKTIGTVTNVDGYFELSLPDQIAEVVVSYIGFKSKIIKLSDFEQEMQI